MCKRAIVIVRRIDPPGCMRPNHRSPIALLQIFWPTFASKGRRQFNLRAVLRICSASASSRANDDVSRPLLETRQCPGPLNLPALACKRGRVELADDFPRRVPTVARMGWQSLPGERELCQANQRSVTSLFGAVGSWVSALKFD